MLTLLDVNKQYLHKLVVLETAFSNSDVLKKKTLSMHHHKNDLVENLGLPAEAPVPNFS